jgi:3-oxoacyl-[acyl-carrier protein] reductase
MRRGGKVVLLSSINGIAGAAGQTNYSLSKGALLGYARALAAPLSRRGVSINCVAPGFIETDMVRLMPPMLQFLGRRANALSQGGLPQDVAAAVAFLAAPYSDGITGQCLRVCGLNAVGR